jgi:hypothetical protein
VKLSIDRGSTIVKVEKEGHPCQCCCASAASGNHEINLDSVQTINISLGTGIVHCIFTFTSGSKLDIAGGFDYRPTSEFCEFLTATLHRLHPYVPRRRHDVLGLGAYPSSIESDKTLDDTTPTSIDQQYASSDATALSPDAPPSSPSLLH